MNSAINAATQWILYQCFVSDICCTCHDYLSPNGHSTKHNVQGGVMVLFVSNNNCQKFFFHKEIIAEKIIEGLFCGYGIKLCKINY